MTKDEKILCLSMVFGDGHIRHNQPELSIKHGEAQKEYLEWKAQILAQAVGKNVNVGQVRYKDHIGYAIYVTHKFFKVLREKCYQDGRPIYPRKLLDKLTPQALAIWYMDDGSLYAKKRHGKVHAYELCLSTCCDEKTAIGLVSYFYEVWGVVFTVKRNKGMCSIRCGTTEARKFLAIVKPHILDCLQYKASM